MRTICALLVVLLVIACAPEKPKEITIQGEAFGTTYAVKYFGEVNEAEHIQKGIDSVIFVMNKSLSTYLRTSDISKINRGDSTVVVDQMFEEVYTLSRKLHTLTEGYFDPTIGVLRNAYGFGDTKPLATIDSIKLDSMMQYVGMDKVRLTSEGTIHKEHPEVYFDFNAVAKGYGIDRIAIFLDTEGISDFLVELGGEIRTQGQNLTKDASWIVGVESITSQLENRTATVSLRLDDRSMAGSGNYRKNRVDPITGQYYVHTINPLTGSAEKSDVLSAHVIAPTCAEADAWATSFMAMGLERSKAVLATLKDIDAYLVFSIGKDATGTYITPGFEEVLNR